MLWKAKRGRCIYQSATGIKVMQNSLFRWLSFGGSALQTMINRYFPRFPALYYIKPMLLAVKQQPGNCCMLGLGGGGLAHALSPFLKTHQLIAVEKNQEVIELAQRFFKIEKIPNLKIINQDANLFVRECPMQFSHLFIDLFNAETFPPNCNNEEFFSHCKQLLLPDGILALNLANRDEQKQIFEIIKKQFASATIIVPVRRSVNIIVFASQSKDLLTIFKKSRHVQRLVWDPIWGYLAKVKCGI